MPGYAHLTAEVSQAGLIGLVIKSGWVSPLQAGPWKRERCGPDVVLSVASA